MPLYDRCCRNCGWEAIDVHEPINLAAPPCPVCGEKTERAWLTKPSAVMGDEMDVTIKNGTKEPIRFRSREAFKRWKQEHGYEDRVRHVPLQGSDTSPHTTNWAAQYDPYTAENVRILIERAFQQSNHEPQMEPLHVNVTSGELSKEEVRKYVGR